MKMINNLKGARPPKVITDLRHLVVSGAECFGEKSLYIYKDINGEEAHYSYIKLKEEVEYIRNEIQYKCQDGYYLNENNECTQCSNNTNICNYVD